MALVGRNSRVIYIRGGVDRNKEGTVLKDEVEGKGSLTVKADHSTKAWGPRVTTNFRVTHLEPVGAPQPEQVAVVTQPVELLVVPITSGGTLVSTLRAAVNSNQSISDYEPWGKGTTVKKLKFKGKGREGVLVEDEVDGKVKVRDIKTGAVWKIRARDNFELVNRWPVCKEQEAAEDDIVSYIAWGKGSLVEKVKYRGKKSKGVLVKDEVDGSVKVMDIETKALWKLQPRENFTLLKYCSLENELSADWDAVPFHGTGAPEVDDNREEAALEELDEEEDDEKEVQEEDLEDEEVEEEKEEKEAEEEKSEETANADAGNLTSGMFLHRHSLNIISWNALKMKLSDDAVTLGKFASDLIACAEQNPDVIVLQEIPFRVGPDRVNTLRQALELRLRESGEREHTFDTIFSERTANDHDEIHAILVRRREGLTVMGRTTLYNLVGKGENSPLEYAPLCVHLKDTRYSYTSQDVLVTSVHFPPNSTSRRQARDRCYETIFNSQCYYNTVLRDLGGAGKKALSWTWQGAKDNKLLVPATHIVCGDFNMALEKTFGYSENWSRLSDNSSTSSGGHAYDHFVINTDALVHVYGHFEVLSITEEHIQNSSQAKIGISDHDPILLILKERPVRRPVRKMILVTAAAAADAAVDQLPLPSGRTIIAHGQPPSSPH